jgi:hypothetical protein
MTVNANLTSTATISGGSPITVNFILSSLPANMSKVYFNFGDDTTQTVSWRVTSVAASSLSTLPISSNASDIRNRIVTKTFTRDSLLQKSIYTVGVSAYSFLTFAPTAYQVTVGPVTVPAIESTNLSSMKIVKTKYINDNKLMVIFEDQTTGRVYPVFTDPNFNTTTGASTAEYVSLSGSTYALNDIWKPASISYINNKLDLDASSVGSSEGIVFSYNPLQGAIKDIGSNNNTVALLTEQSKLRDLQNEKIIELHQNNLVRNSLQSANGRYLTKNANSVVYFSATGESLNNIFKLEFDENDDTISIVSEDINDKNYLTLASNGLSSYFTPFRSDIDHRQKFKYILSPLLANSMLMFCDIANNGNYKALYVGSGTVTSTVCAVSTLNFADPIYSIFNLAHNDKTIKTNEVISSSSVVYQTILENNLTIYDDLQIVDRVSFDNNYIFTIEPKSDKETAADDLIYIKSNNIALKNLISTNYKNALRIANRDYKSVLTTDNIINDKHNKLLVSYESNQKQIDLLADKLTYFHYPFGSTSINLSAAGLVNEGAIAGAAPERSDRIWKYQSGYEQRTNKGRSLGLQNGLWLCSWLKAGNSNCDPVWMDRWYDPTNITYKLALAADEPNPYIVDIDSTMSLDPGVLYKYFHIGKEYSMRLIEQADFASSSGKILEIKDWDTPDVNIVNGSSANIEYTRFNESELSLNGTEYISFSSNDSFYPEFEMSASCWVYFDNWRNAPASQILGNHYEGGYGISFETGVDTNLLVFADRTYGHLFVANTENKYLNDKALPGVSATVTDISYGIDGHVWVLDGNNSKVHVYNPLNNTFIRTVNLPASSQYTLASNTANGDFYAYDNQNKRFTRIPSTGGILTHTPLTSLSSTFVSMSALTTFPINGFFIDTADRIQPYIGTIAFEDENGDKWHYYGSNFVKNNKDYVLHLCGAEDVKVDGDYNIWYIKGKTLYQTDREGKMLLTKEYPYLTAGIKKLALTRELTKSGWADFVWIMDSNSLIKYTTAGRFVKISKPKEFLNIAQYSARDRNKLDIFLPSKSTAYDFYKDGKIIPPGLADDNYLTVKFNIAAGNSSQTIRKLKYNTNTLSKGWHHLAFVFDSGQGSAKFYVDGRLGDSMSFDSGLTVLSYAQKNKFYVGNTNGFNDLYSQDYLLNDAVTMVGKLDDLRLYAKALTNNDILVLSRKKLEFADVPFSVTTPVRQYMEEIDKINSHRLPGFKSNVYNIRIVNSDLSDNDIKQSIENAICDAVKKITPVGSKLNKIVWE